MTNKKLGILLVIIVFTTVLTRSPPFVKADGAIDPQEVFITYSYNDLYPDDCDTSMESSISIEEYILGSEFTLLGTDPENWNFNITDIDYYTSELGTSGNNELQGIIYKAETGTNASELFGSTGEVLKPYLGSGSAWWSFPSFSEIQIPLGETEFWVVLWMDSGTGDWELGRDTTGGDGESASKSEAYTPPDPSPPDPLSGESTATTYAFMIRVDLDAERETTTTYNQYYGTSTDYEALRCIVLDGGFPSGVSDKTFKSTFPKNEDITNITAGGSLDLDGDGDYVEMANDDAFNITSSGHYKIESWIYPHQLGYRVILSRFNYSLLCGYEFGIWSDGRIVLIVGNGTTTENLYSTGIVTLNEWSNVTVAFNISSGRADFYLNGEYTGYQETTLENLGDYPGVLRIGRRSTTAQFQFDGLVDNIKMYNNTNLVGYWKFDGDLEDNSGEGNDGTKNGDPEYSPGGVQTLLSTSEYSTAYYNSTHSLLTIEDEQITSYGPFFNIWTETYLYYYNLYGLYSGNGTRDGAINVTAHMATESDIFEVDGTYVYSSNESVLMFSFDVGAQVRRIYTVASTEDIYLFYPESPSYLYEFEIKDFTGQIGAQECYLEARRSINGTLHLTERMKIADVINDVPLTLSYGKVYSLRVYFADETTYDFGYYIAGVDATPILALTEIAWGDQTQTVYDDITSEATRVNATHIRLTYTDTTPEYDTLRVNFTVEYRNGTQAYNSSVASSNSVVFNWYSADNETDYVVHLWANHEYHGQIYRTWILDYSRTFQNFPDLGIFGTWGGLLTTNLLSIFVGLVIAGTCSFKSRAVAPFLFVGVLAMFTYLGGASYTITQLTLGFIFSIIIGLVSMEAGR